MKKLKMKIMFKFVELKNLSDLHSMRTNKHKNRNVYEYVTQNHPYPSPYQNPTKNVT